MDAVHVLDFEDTQAGHPHAVTAIDRARQAWGLSGTEEFFPEGGKKAVVLQRGEHGGEGSKGRPTALEKNGVGPTAFGRNETGFGEEIRGDGLLDFDAMSDFIVFVMSRAGLKSEPDLPQRWRVGEHELVVHLWIDRRSVAVLRVHAGWPDSSELGEIHKSPRSLALAEVYAIAVTGELRRLPGPTLARWKRRAVMEAGLIDPPASSLPPLHPPPQGTSASAIRKWQEAVRVWAIIGSVLAVRRLTEPAGTPLPLADSFLAAWGNVSPTLVYRGRYWLVRRGWLEDSGQTCPSRFPRPTKLWLVRGDVEGRAAK